MTAPLLVFTPESTSRIRYTFKHIFTRVLGIKITFTSEVNQLVSYEGPKCSYTPKKLGSELHFTQVELLREQGINDAMVKVADWDGVPCLFPVKEEGAALPFDIFAASFYHLSRYEEYLPHVKDAKGRFPATESLAFKNHYLETPVVDIWIQRLLAVLLEHFPDLEYTLNSYKKQLVVDVPQAFKYRKIGFLRTAAGYASDAVNLRIKNIWRRTQVILGLRKDPYDIFGWLVQIQKQLHTKIIVLFELGNAAESATNIAHSKRTFQSLIKMVGDYCNVGVLNSATACKNIEALAEEKQRAERITNRSLTFSKFKNQLFTIPQSYRHLIDQEVVQDLSLEYTEQLGFRAGTCNSFFFYDLDYEIQTPLLIKPVAVPLAAIITSSRKVVDSLRLEQLNNKVIAVNGTLVLSCANQDLSKAFTRKIVKEILLEL